METPWGHFGQLEVSHLGQVGLGKYSPAGVGDGIWDRGALLIYKKGFSTDPVSGEVCRALQKILKVDTQPGHSGQPGNQVNQTTRLHHSTWLQPLNQVTRGQLGVQLGGQKVVDVISLMIL